MQLAAHDGIVLLLDRRPGHGVHGRRVAIFLDLGFLKQRVFQKLLLHRLHQLQARELQQLDGLLQLRSHDQLLGEFELLAEFQGHRAVISSVLAV